MHETEKLDSFAIDFAFQRILEAKIFEQGQKKTSSSRANLQVSGVQEVLMNRIRCGTTLDQKCSKKIVIKCRQARSAFAKPSIALH